MSEFISRPLERKMRTISVSLLLFFILVFADLSSCVATKKEKTLAMIKPDGVSGNFTDQIKNMILESGFNIVREKMLQLNEEKVALFYAEHSGRSFFTDLVKYMSSGPVYVMVLEKLNAISDWRNLIGPTDARKAKLSQPNSIRAICGVDSERNCIHGSDSSQSAAREIAFLFGEISSADGLWEDRIAWRVRVHIADPIILRMRYIDDDDDGCFCQKDVAMQPPSGRGGEVANSDI